MGIIYMTKGKIEVGSKLDDIVGRAEITKEQLWSILNKDRWTVNINGGVIPLADLKRIADSSDIIVETGEVVKIEHEGKTCEIDYKDILNDGNCLKVTKDLLEDIEKTIEYTEFEWTRKCELAVAYSCGTVVLSRVGTSTAAEKMSELDKYFREKYIRTPKDEKFYGRMKSAIWQYAFVIPVEIVNKENMLRDQTWKEEYTYQKKR